MDSNSPWSGYFCHVSDDGKETKLETDADNSLFYAIALAINPGLSPREVSEKANALRSEVGTEVNTVSFIFIFSRCSFSKTCCDWYIVKIFIISRVYYKLRMSIEPLHVRYVP